MLKMEQGIKIRREAVILIIILHSFLHQTDVFPHQTNSGTGYGNRLFPHRQITCLIGLLSDQRAEGFGTHWM